MKETVMAPPDATEVAAVRARAVRLIVAFGVVSLFADMVYEGARSILGPFLLTLGASAAVVGLIAGVGEFAGYALRVVSGYAADRTGRYWALTIGGYALTVVAVPLLGLVGRVDLALALVVAERLGKAVRTPARDVLLSNAGAVTGRGWGFGLHEALDQVGAILSPLLLAAVLAARAGDYRLAFLSLAAPGVATLAALAWARVRAPEPAVFEQFAQARVPAAPPGEAPVPSAARPLRRYLLFVGVATVGFAPFPLAAFHLDAAGVVSTAQVPLLFAFAMAVDAGAALLGGRVYDRRGLAVLAVVPLLTVASLLLFTTSPALVWAGAAVWGAALGLQESTLRAVVGALVPAVRRGVAYGMFNLVYGSALLVAGAGLGAAYQRSVGTLAVVVVAAGIAAFVVWARLPRGLPAAGG
jgi:MFS family permease